MAKAPHINQPGGRYRESVHPNIRGRELELRSLADAVRRLIHITVTNTASTEETASAAQSLHAIADQLEGGLPEVAPSRFERASEPSEPHDYFQYDCMLGPYNPLALPIQMEWQPPRAVGHAHFTTAYEGPPGCVHGAILAAAFDQVFNIANIMGQTAGPTRELALTYRKPTPLEADLIFEAQVEDFDGRRILTRGHARHGDTVTVEARGVFIHVGQDRVMEMGDRARGDGS